MHPWLAACGIYSLAAGSTQRHFAFWMHAWQREIKENSKVHCTCGENNNVRLILVCRYKDDKSNDFVTACNGTDTDPP